MAQDALPGARSGEPPRAPPSPDPPGHAGLAGVLIVAGGFIIVMTTALALWLWYERAQTLADGVRIANNLALVLREQTGRTLQAVDLTLLGVVESLQLTPPRSEHDVDFEQAMRRRRAALPYVRALFVIGPDGFITQDTDHPFTPRVSLADRGYFIVQAQDPTPDLHIGPPLISRSVGTWFVSMSRRVGKPDGSFGGVAVAAIEPRYFEDFYKALALRRGDTVSLYNDDAVLVARYPHADQAIGQSFPHFELFQRARESPSGTYRITSAFDDARRIFSYRALDPYPFVVVVGLSEDALLVEWRQRAGGGIALAVAAAILAMVLAYFAVRQQGQRERARRRLVQAQRLEALGQLTGGIVHDFRNLLMAVSAGANLIRSRSTDGEVRTVAEMIAESVAQGNQLTAQLLTFARQQALKIQAEDANALLRQSESLLRHAAGLKVRLALDLDPALWPCLIDHAQFDRSMVNLIVNAKDAMPAGGEVRIATANWRVNAGPGADVLPAGDYVRVTVTDDGEGMAPEVLQHALDPFFTTKADSGTGLGLSQSYGFVRQIGGDVRIESQVGLGTSVHLFFPRAAGSAAP